MAETTKASASVADMTNYEELISDLFDYKMSVSKLKVCRTNNLGITGVQVEVSTPPGDGEQETLALAPIGNMETDCQELEIADGAHIDLIELRSGS